MKRFILCTLCLSFFFSQGYAQVSLAELLNGGPFIGSSSSDIAINAVKREISIIRQQFRLTRDGKTYGKNNLPYYGESYSLGIKISNGMILMPSVIEPWSEDANYNRLNTSNQYKPELFWTYQRSVTDTVYHDIDLELGTEYVYPLDSKAQLYIHEEKKGDFGLTIDSTVGDKSGYMVWVCTDSSLQDSAMVIRFNQVPLHILASEDSSYVSLTAKDTSNVLGGIYLVPKFDRGGKIQLMLVGVAVPGEKDREWNLCLLTKGTVNKLSRTESSDVNKNDIGSELTPIEIPNTDKSREKKKK